MKRIVYCILATLIIVGCGQSYEEKRKLSRKERLRLMREDSAALKIAVMPTLDCLPLFVAREHQLFQAAGADVRLKMFTAQMDCDTALARGRVEGSVTDVVRAERLKKEGTALEYLTVTNAYWQLFTNRTARIKSLKQLDDKMILMTRYSATDMLSDIAVDSGKLKTERVYRIQVNDVNIRLKMLLASEVDAALLTEPQATQARTAHHPMLLDSRNLGINFGVIAFSEQALKKRQKQMEAFRKGYNQACDSLSRYGISRYRQLLAEQCKIKVAMVDSLPKDIKFQHITSPAEADIERAQKWLNP